VAVERKDSEKERGRTQSVRVKGKERKGSIRATEREAGMFFFPPFQFSVLREAGGRQKAVVIHAVLRVCVMKAVERCLGDCFAALLQADLKLSGTALDESWIIE